MTTTTYFPDIQRGNEKNLSMKTSLRYILISIALLFLVSLVTEAQKKYYVATWGKASNNGSLDNPWDITTGLKGGPMAQGDTLFIMGGTYYGYHMSHIEPFYTNPATAKPIVVMPYNNETVVFDGTGRYDNIATLTVRGSMVIFRDLIFMSSSTNRITNDYDVKDIETNTGIAFEASYSKLINCIIYNNIGVGVGFWQAAYNSEMYGNIIFNNGYMGGTERGVAHAVYSQNREELGTKQIRDNVLFNSYGWGIHLYGSWGSSNIEVTGNISFNNGVLALGKKLNNNILAGGMEGFDKMYIKNNYLFYNFGGGGMNLQMGFKNTNKTCVVQDNYIVGNDALYLRKWSGATITGNKIVNKGGALVRVEVPDGVTYNNYNINNNKYWGAGGSGSYFSSEFQSGSPVHGLNMSFTDWQSKTKADQSSTYSSTLPPENWVFVRPNEYEQGRAHVVIYNFKRDATINVDVSNVLSIGAEFEVRDIQNILDEPVLKGVYSGGTISLPMNLTKVLSVPGITPNVLEHTTNEFNVFLIKTLKGSNNKLQISSLTPRETLTTSVLEFYSPKAQTISLTIYNQDGTRVVQPVNISAVKGTNKYTVDISKLASGRYRITINDATDNASIEITRLEDPVVDPPVSITTCPASPAGEEITLKYTAPRNQQVEISIYQQDGTNLIRNIVNAVEGNNTYTMNISELIDGAYYISVANEASTDYCSFQKKTEIPIVFEITNCAPPIVTDLITVDYTSPKNATVQCTILNSASAVVLTETLTAKTGPNKSIINVKDLISGNYTLRLTLDNSSESCSFEKRTVVMDRVEIISCRYQLDTKLTTLSIRSPKAQTITTDVFNEDGERVLDPKRHNIQAGVGSINIDFKTLQPHTYYITVFDGENYSYCTTEKPDAPATDHTINITSITPVPITNTINASYTASHAGTYSATIFNKDGAQQSSTSITAVAGSNSFSSNVASLAVGLYFLNISNGTTSDVEPFYIYRETSPLLHIIECVPNHSYDKLFITYYSPQRINVTLQVTNPAADIISNTSLNAQVGINYTSLDISALSNGEYLLSLTDGSITSHKLFFKISKPEANIEMLSCPDDIVLEELNLSYYSPRSQRVTVNFYTNEGKQILSPESKNAVTGNNTLKITSIKDLAAGNYYVTISNNTKIIYCQFEKGESTIEPEEPIKITNCPESPAGNNITIGFTSPKDQMVDIVISNIDGVEVITDKYEAIEGDNTFEKDISELEDGSYYIKISAGEINDYCQFQKKTEVPILFEITGCEPHIVTDLITISYNSPKDTEITATITLGLNNVVKTEFLAARKGPNNSIINVKDLEAGSFTLYLTLDGSTKNCSFEKEPEIKEYVEVVNCRYMINSKSTTLTVKSPLAQDLWVEIYDSNGKRVSVPDQVTVKTGTNELSVDMSNYPPAKYYITLFDNEHYAYCITEKPDSPEDQRVITITSVTPVPVTNQLNCTYTTTVAGRHIGTIYYYTGEQYKSTNTTAVVGNNTFRTDVSQLSEGYYLLVISNSTSSDVAEFYISRASSYQLDLINCVPNRSFDVLFTRFFSSDARDVEMIITDKSDDVIAQETFTAKRGVNIEVVDIKGLAIGKYSLTLSAGGLSPVKVFFRIEPPKADIELINCPPSPVYDRLQVSFSSPVAQRVTINYYTPQGTQVLTPETLNARVGNNTHTSSAVNNLQPGSYFVTISNSTKILLCEFRKENKDPDITITLAGCSYNEQTDLLSMNYNLYKTSDVTVTITDSKSMEVLRDTKTNQPAGDNVYELDVSSLSDGVYNVNIADYKSSAYCSFYINRTPEPVLELINCTPKEATTYVNIEFFAPKAGNISYTVKNNSSGTTDPSRNLNAKAGLNQRDIDITSLVAGSYTITISDGITSDSCTFVKKMSEPEKQLEIYTCSVSTDGNTLTATIYSPTNQTVDTRMYTPTGILVSMPVNLQLKQGVNIIDIDISSLDPGKFYYVVSDNITYSYCQVDKQSDNPDIILKVIKCEPIATATIANIMFYVSMDGEAEVKVVNRQETIVQEFKVMATAGLNTATVNLSGLPNGYYYLVIMFEEVTSFCEVERSGQTGSQDLVILKCQPKFVNNLLFVEVNSEIQGSANITALSVHDNTVEFTREVNLTRGKNKVAIDLSKIPIDEYRLIMSTQTAMDYCFFTKTDEDSNSTITLINFSPNPVRTILNIEYYSYLSDDVAIDIHSSTGGKAFSEIRKQNQGYNSHQLDFSTYPPGIYFVRLRQIDQSVAFKVVKL